MYTPGPKWLAASLIAASAVVGLSLFFATMFRARPPLNQPAPGDAVVRAPDVARENTGDNHKGQPGRVDPQSDRFLAQQLDFEQPQGFRKMLTMRDVERAAVPLPETVTLTFPSNGRWSAAERRIRRDASVPRDSKTATQK